MALLVVLHIILCVFLILVVLLQAGKGADMGTTFGAGSSQTVFGSGGAAPFLTKLTSAIAVLFMLTSISLTVMSSRQVKKSVIEEVPSPVTQQPETKDQKTSP